MDNTKEETKKPKPPKKKKPATKKRKKKDDKSPRPMTPLRINKERDRIAKAMEEAANEYISITKQMDILRIKASEIKELMQSLSKEDKKLPCPSQ